MRKSQSLEYLINQTVIFCCFYKYSANVTAFRAVQDPLLIFSIPHSFFLLTSQREWPSVDLPSAAYPFLPASGTPRVLLDCPTIPVSVTASGEGFLSP